MPKQAWALSCAVTTMSFFQDTFHIHLMTSLALFLANKCIGFNSHLNSTQRTVIRLLMSYAVHILSWLNLEVLTQAYCHSGWGCVKCFQMWPLQINWKTNHHAFHHQEKNTNIAHWLICSLWSPFPYVSCPNYEEKGEETQTRELGWCSPRCQCLPQLDPIQPWRGCEIVSRKEISPCAPLGKSQSGQSAYASPSWEGLQNTYLGRNQKQSEHSSGAVCVWGCV